MKWLILTLLLAGVPLLSLPGCVEEEHGDYDHREHFEHEEHEEHERDRFRDPTSMDLSPHRQSGAQGRLVVTARRMGQAGQQGNNGA